MLVSQVIENRNSLGFLGFCRFCDLERMRREKDNRIEECNCVIDCYENIQ